MMERVMLHGVVSLRVCISQKGRVLSAAVIDGNPMAFQAVLDSVQKWIFKPYRADGCTQNVTADLKVDYDFRSPPHVGSDPH
jgi:outer membrane biosynthesis protein TonB